MQKLLLGYRDNMRVEVENGIAVTAKTVADLRALTAWPDGLALNIHVDLDPRFSVVRVERTASLCKPPDPTVPKRRFPPPWTVEDIGGSFVVKAGNDRPLVFIYYGEGVVHRSLARLLTRNAARRIAVGIATLPKLLLRKDGC